MHTPLEKRFKRSKYSDTIFDSLMKKEATYSLLFSRNASKMFHLSMSNSLQRRNIKATFNKLVKLGYIEFKQSGTKRKIRLSKTGKEYASRLFNKPPQKKRLWDGFWRIIVFDVPEKRRPIRDKLRSLLKLHGLVRLNDSVWVSPYPFEELLHLAKIDLKLGQNVRYIIAREVEYEETLLTHFKLERKN